MKIFVSDDILIEKGEKIPGLEIPDGFYLMEPERRDRGRMSVLHIGPDERSDGRGGTVDETLCRPTTAAYEVVYSLFGCMVKGTGEPYRYTVCDKCIKLMNSTQPKITE